MLLSDQFLSPYKLILGSGSPRRSEILNKAHLSFIKRVVEIDETFPEEMDPRKVPEYLALAKAAAHDHQLAEDEILLTADSVVILDNKVIGKPTSRNNAIEILLRLSGKTHTVVTGFCLKHISRVHSNSILSKVHFDNLSMSEIEHYIDSAKPFDKAGAYGIQDWLGANKVSRIEGSYFNIMGLPMNEVYKDLSDFRKKLSDHF